MAGKGKKPESEGPSTEDISRLEELAKEIVAGSAGKRRTQVKVDIKRVAAGESDRYIQILASDGKIVDISNQEVIDKISERVTQMLESVGDIAQRAGEAGKNIAKKAGGIPFELDEVKVGLCIKVEAGIVVFGFGGDVNLELKFVRERPGAGKAL